jgi:predicted nucleic acid-binding protein
VIIVLDASALVEYLLRTPRGATAEAVIAAPDADLHVPYLCDIEVCAALRRLLLERRLSIDRAGSALRDYLDLSISRHGHGRLMGEILRLRSNCSAYDASYVALAASLRAVFVTCDDRLARAVRKLFPHWDVRS